MSKIFLVLNALRYDAASSGISDAETPSDLPDGWYVGWGSLGPRGPYDSRRTAEKAAESVTRYFALEQYAFPEIPEDGEYKGEGAIVSVTPPDEAGVRVFTVTCFYDEKGVFELRTTVGLQLGLEVMKAALEAEAGNSN